MTVLTAKKHRPSISGLITILMIYPLPQMAIDVYLPSWPSMASYFHATHAEMQLSLIVYLFCLGVAQLVYGALSERYGRKSLLLIGSSIFLISTVFCALATSIEQLIFLRAIQGLGIGCGFTIASAILSDLFTGKKLAKMSSYAATVYSLSVIFAPALGGAVQQYIGWRANFLVMVMYCLCLMLCIGMFVAETKSADTKPKFSYIQLARSYLGLLSNAQFTMNVLSLIIAYGTMVAFNTVAPFILQEKLHLTAVDYGKYLFLVGIAYCLSTIINSYLIKFLRLESAIKLGFTLMLLSSIGMFMNVYDNGLSANTFILFVCIAFFSVGFIYPNGFANALDLFSEKGPASAFIGCAILIGVSVSTLLSLYYSGSGESYLSVILLVSSIAGITLAQFKKAQIMEIENV